MEPEPSIIPLVTLAMTINYSLIISCVVLFILLICSALISGAEVAFFSLSKTDIKNLSEENEAEKNIRLLLQKPKKLLATILIANNFINILVVLLFSYVGTFLFHSISSYVIRFLVEVVLVTFLILLFGEVLPKVYATRNALLFASKMALPLKIINYLFSIVSIPLLFLNTLVEKAFGKKSSNFSVEKLSQALEITSDTATTDNEQKLLEGIVSFGATETEQIMTPRIDIFAISTEDSYQEILPKVIEKGFSRNPVYKDSIDDIVGVLYMKDLLPHLDKKDFEWQTLLKEPYFVPENKKLDDLLKEFQEKKNHLAIVVDEYGGTSGIVSLDDVIEEIVGEISDEYDDDDDLSYTKLDDNNYLFEGKTTLKDFYKILDIEDETIDLFEKSKGESETLAGLMLELSGKFLKKNEKVVFHNYLFKVNSIDKRRIKEVKVTLS
ncbi:MAG: gliding motility-associated protein GldE [Flavobacteriaceae bacterium]|nr:gliding motility-associated protein GldE [Flavobacteriaceae bacterium]